MTIDYQAYLILQSNNKTQLAKKRSKKLIRQFENHPNKERFLQDLNKTEKINKFKKARERWHNDDQHRKSLSEIGWTEEHIIEYDKIALGNHSYIATRGERDRNERRWVLKLKKKVLKDQRINDRISLKQIED